MRKKVQALIDKIRPMLQKDDGDVELIDVDSDGVVTVRMVGTCAGCAMSRITLKQGIEKVMVNEIPEIKRVENIS
jgi:Fe-S cluster biogenesis protein NfuA